MVLPETIDSISRNSPSPILLILITTFMIAFVAIKSIKQLRKRHHARSLLKNFDGPPGHWLFGNSSKLTFDENMLKTFHDWILQYGGIFKTHAGSYTYLVLTDPDAVATLLKRAGLKDSNGHFFLAEWIGSGILTSDGPHWFRNRRLLTPGFHFEVLKPYSDIFNQSAATLVDKWKGMCSGKKTDVEMFEHVSLTTLDSLLRTAFSTEIHCQTKGMKHPYITAVYQIFETMALRPYSLLNQSNFYFYNFTSAGKKSRNAINTAKQFTQEVVNRKREEKTEVREARKRKYIDFVDILLDAKDEDGVGLSNTEILDEVDTFMFAGHDTTASGISWFMYYLAQYPEHQDRCREEVNEILGDKDKVEWSDLSRLEYLTMCLKESLRISTPVPRIARELDEDLEFPDGRIAPAGTRVTVYTHFLHHNPAVWANPDVYDPFRFSPENSQGKHSHAFLPFSAGPRNCIGQNFAMNEMKITAAHILKNFKLEVDSNRPPIRKLFAVLRTENGLWLILQPI